MKNIEDYLHLYLGCECDYNGDTGTLYEINRNGARLMGVFGGGHIGHGLAKPILRPLSDMTGDEDQEADDIYYSIADKHSEDFIKVQTANAAVTNYLRKAGIDCDGLIESGLAIDKTKQPTP